MITISEMLGPLEADRLRMLASPEPSKLRSLSTSFYNFKIPLESRSGRTEILAIEVRPRVKNPDKILSTLLWNAMFGKKFKVVHWNILFQCFTRTFKTDKSSLAVLSILCILTANAEVRRWNSNMPNVMKILRSKRGKNADKSIQELLRLLPIQLPKSRVEIETVLDINFDSKIVFKKPKEIARIGVGYKDKGSLGVGGQEAHDPDGSFMESGPSFEGLLRQVQAIFIDVL